MIGGTTAAIAFVLLILVAGVIVLVLKVKNLRKSPKEEPYYSYISKTRMLGPKEGDKMYGRIVERDEGKGARVPSPHSDDTICGVAARLGIHCAEESDEVVDSVEVETIGVDLRANEAYGTSPLQHETETGIGDISNRMYAITTSQEDVTRDLCIEMVRNGAYGSPEISDGLTQEEHVEITVEAGDAKVVEGVAMGTSMTMVENKAYGSSTDISKEGADQTGDLAVATALDSCEHDGE